MTQSEKVSSTVNIDDLPTLETKAYWVLDKLTVPGKDRFTANEVAEYLIEKERVSTSRQAVGYSLQKKKGACHKNSEGYKLMSGGEAEVLKHATQKKVVFIDGNKPFSAKNFSLKEVIGDSYKEIAICDPYVDTNTLDVIFKNFKKGIPIRLLTVNLVEKLPGVFKRQLGHLNNEGFNVEVRVYKSSQLHDRYIMTEKIYLHSGNSLNYIGQKESTLILLGSDTQQIMMATFNGRWKTSVTV